MPTTQETKQDKNNRPFHITDNFTDEDKKEWYRDQLKKMVNLKK